MISWLKNLFQNNYSPYNANYIKPLETALKHYEKTGIWREDLFE